MKTVIRPILMLTFAILVLSGCRDSDRDNDVSTVAVEAHLYSENMHHDLFKLVDEAAKNEQGIKNLTCAVITADTLSSPKTMSIYFGASNCAGGDGVNRRGTINVTFTGLYSDSGTVTTITLLDYYVNDYSIKGTTTITNKGVNGDGNTWYLIDVNNARVIEPSAAWNIVWNSDRTMEWVTGASTPTDVSDDVFTTRGEFSGADRVGVIYTGTIVTPVTTMSNCNYISSGVVTLTPSTLSQRTIDYGTSCDAIATATISDAAQDITIPL